MGDKQKLVPPSDDGKVGDCIKEGFIEVRIPCRAVKGQHLEMVQHPPPHESREGNGSISRPEVRAVREEKPERSEKTCPRVPWWGSLLIVIGLATLGVLLGVLVISIQWKYVSEPNKHVMSTSHPTLKMESNNDITPTSTAIGIGLGNTQGITKATKSKYNSIATNKPSEPQNYQSTPQVSSVPKPTVTVVSPSNLPQVMIMNPDSPVREARSSGAPPETTSAPVTVGPGVLVVASRVTWGPLHAKAIIRPSENYRSKHGIMNSTRLILDKPGVNSRRKCWDLCRHQNRDDAPPSEPSCLAAEFNSLTNTCRFAGSKPVYRPVNGSETVLFKYDCTHAFTPTENWKFWRFNNRLPNATNSKSFSLNVSSLPDCYDEFVNSRTYRSRWGGFGFNHNTKKCTLYSHLSTSELKVDAGSELYVDSNDGSDIVCSDAFPETSPGKADSQGVLQNGSFPMRHDCFLLCRNDGFRHFEKCFGFDYNNYDKSCHFSTNSNYSLTSRANTTHYRRARRCFNGISKDPFISTRDTSLSGGYKIWVPSYIPWSCARACLGWNVAITFPPCYGFSFNHTDHTCFLYLEFDHARGVVGASPGVDQFRRILYSNYSCSETYIKTSNASSQGGIEQPKDINTFARCASRCIDYAIATDHTCHGFDLNTTTDLCTIYLEADFKLWPSDQVDNYRRNKTCELPYY